MKNKSNHSFFVILPVIWLLGTSFLDPKPQVTEGAEVLFRIERSRDADEVWYTIHSNPDGSVNHEIPVQVFWMRKSTDNRTAPLTGIQKKFSYGIQSIDPDPSSGDTWNFKLAAYNNRMFVLKKTEDGRYGVFTISQESEVKVTKLYIKFDGGTFLAPAIAYVQLTGIDPRTGAEIREIITGGIGH